MDLCTYEVLGHAARLNMSSTEREALLAMSPEERAAIGDHVMTIDELNARGAAISEETPKERTHRVEDATVQCSLGGTATSGDEDASHELSGYFSLVCRHNEVQRPTAHLSSRPYPHPLPTWPPLTTTAFLHPLPHAREKLISL